jgi:hypothetical protein
MGGAVGVVERLDEAPRQVPAKVSRNLRTGGAKLPAMGILGRHVFAHTAGVTVSLISSG